MSFRRPLRTLFMTLLGAVAAAAGANAQSMQPAVIPTGNWPVSVSAGGSLPAHLPADLLFCDPGINGVSTGCHVLRGVGDGSFTRGDDLLCDPAAVNPVVCTAAFLNPLQNKYYAATLSNRPAQPTVMDLTVNGGPVVGFIGFGFNIVGTKPAIPGPIASFPYNTSVTAPNGNLGILCEEVANGYLYMLQGTGQIVMVLPLPDGPGPFIVGDFNGDANTDVLTLGTTNHVLTLHPGNGDGSFSTGKNYTLRGGIYSMLVADVDGDGIADLVVEGANGALSFFRGTATGFSSTPIALTGAQDGTTANGGQIIAIADLNGDHIPEIITATPAGVSVLLGQGGFNYKLLGIYNAGPGRSSYALADFNGDGHLDLALDSPEGIAVLYGNADGSFQTSRSYSSGQPAYALTLGRFHGSSRGQGNVDAAVATGIPQFQVLTGDAQGGFAVTTPPWPAAGAQTNSARTLWSSILTGYLDNDAVLDLAVTKNGKPPFAGGEGITMYFGNGDGTFTAPVIADPSGSNHIGDSSFATFKGDGVIHILSFDTTACGEFVTASRATVPGSIFNANPTGSPYNLLAPGYVAIGSANVSKFDIVCELNGSLYLYRNDGSGAFLAPTVLPAPAGIAVPDAFGNLPSSGLFPSALLFVDLDGDNFGDLIAIYHNLAADPAHPSSATPNQIYIYWGNGDGTFTAPTVLTTTRNYYEAAIAEIDADLNPDLILSDGYIVSVLPGGGRARTFGAEQHYLAGMGINGIAVDLVNAHNVIVTANGGAVFSNPAINRGTLASNAEVNTGGITVLLKSSLTTTLTGTLTATPTSPGYGRAFTPTAALTPPSGGAVPTGTVTFSIDGVVVGTPVTVDATGTATYAVNAPTYAVGTHTLSAVYSGDATYSPLTLAGTLTVTLLPSQTYITNVVTPIIYGDIIGNIAKGFATPLNPSDTALLDGGTLSFYINGQVVCTLPFITGITQTCPPTTGAGYPVGAYALSSSYSGNQFYLPSTSPYYTVVVLPSDTQGTLVSSANPATLGQNVTLTATFSAPFATPIGSVSFFDGTTLLGSGNFNASGVVTLTTSTLALGPHNITAIYAGTPNFKPSTTPVLVQVIAPRPVATTTILTSSVNPSSVGQSVTFTALVSSGTPVGTALPAPSVSFTVDGVAAATVQLSSQNTASFTTSSLTAGSHTIVATYSGGPDSVGDVFSPSFGNLVQTVNVVVPGSFTLTITPNPISVPIGNYANVLVTVTALNGFAQPVALSCANLPREATCTFGTATIPAGSGSTLLAVSASAPHDCNSNAPYFVSSGSNTWLGLIGASTLVLLIRRRRKFIPAALLTLALAILPPISGCGHCTDLGVYPGNYTFTVTGASTGQSPLTVTQTIQMTAHL